MFSFAVDIAVMTVSMTLLRFWTPASSCLRVCSRASSSVLSVWSVVEMARSSILRTCSMDWEVMVGRGEGAEDIDGGGIVDLVLRCDASRRQRKVAEVMVHNASRSTMSDFRSRASAILSLTVNGHTWIMENHKQEQPRLTLRCYLHGRIFLRQLNSVTMSSIDDPKMGAVDNVDEPFSTSFYLSPSLQRLSLGDRIKIEIISHFASSFPGELL